jgi:hypothetical protein
MAGRVRYAGLQLLDRQLLDRNDVACGKVDDLELEMTEDGTVHVSAILTGPGALLARTGHIRLGSWLRRTATAVFSSPHEEPGRIPMGRVTEIDDHVRVSLDHEEMVTFAAERWVRDHIIGRIPGSGHADG